MPAAFARARTFGWVTLALWACVGTGLELAHAFKLAAYLDDELTRLLLTLAHAHGIGLALVVLEFASHASAIFGTNSTLATAVGNALLLGSVLLPMGFLLGAIRHPEGDPGVAIVLAPMGALLVVAALVMMAVAALRASRRQPPSV